MGFLWPFLGAATLAYFLGAWIGAMVWDDGVAVFLFAAVVALVGGTAITIPWAMRRQARRTR